MPLEKEEGEGEGAGVLPGGIMNAGSSVSRVFKGSEFKGRLRGDLDRMFISFSRCILSGLWSPLMSQHQGRGVISHSSWTWHCPPGFAAFLGLELRYN